jgi:ectoine hydroxylase-related dioxygenase (phytanoyl-CoA dioxygenase family)
MSQLKEDALSRDGVVVTRAACPEAASAACAACLAAGLEGLDRKLALPQTMAERMRGRSLRHFVPVWPACAAVEEPTTQSAFAALRAALAGEAGAILVEALGRDAELRELQVIVSEPGAAAQDVHSDSNWSDAPRLVTMFVALHDLLDERTGPTYFWPQTHVPRCFPNQIWIPPTASLAAERRSVWYALRAGDAVLMDACTWHRGGANTSSGSRRTLLAASFVEASADGGRVLRLGDFL